MAGKQKRKRKPAEPEYHLVGADYDHVLMQSCYGADGSEHFSHSRAVVPLRRVSDADTDADGPAYQLVPTKTKHHVKLREVRRSKGPARVSSDAYRVGWERAFGAGGMIN